jgi:hypothetical protein
MNITDLTPKELRKAADLQEKIQSLQSELTGIFGHEVPTPKTGPTGKRKFSASAKARMRKAQKARWAKIKGTAPSAKPAKKSKMSAQGLANIRAGVLKRMKNQGKAASAKRAKKGKRKMSAAGKAALSAAAKARWAKAKAAGKTTL